MSEVAWLPEALEDVQRLRLFLLDKNPIATVRVAKVLQDGAKLLASFPEAGYPMNDGTDRRELFLPFGASSYVLRYIIDGQIIAIIRVWHGRENRQEH
jgi:plasmid stabilization system protein ParE